MVELKAEKWVALMVVHWADYWVGMKAEKSAAS
jgi:hypothetical protein